ncbi:MAG: MBL fold metallo-hydrolase [Candidatus Bipolaricaulota bacterium]|nr:MBL fold metallo-hydrolase [Candidatus Bipolaricaulota bacterium]
MMLTEKVAENIYILDTEMLGLPRYGSLYILKTPRPTIIETGFSHTLEKTLSALNELKIRPEDVAYIIPTHVHLDHAGGTGDLAHACPNARVVIHEQGAPHLVDPTKLLESVKRAVGPMFGFYGTLRPTPPERLIVVKGGESLDLGGGYQLDVLHAPGHAPHQICLYERKTGGLFTADAAGIYRPWAAGLILTTPPPAFHLEQSLETLERLKALAPRVLFYTHWGAHTQIKLLDDYAEMLRAWVADVEAQKRRLGDDAAVKRYFVEREGPRFQEHYPEPILRGEIEMNTQGILLYLKRVRGFTET